jgi:subtilisin family serine protease
MTISAAAHDRFGTAFELLGIERAWQRTRGSSAVVIGIVDRQSPHSAAGEHDIPGTHAAGVAAGRSCDVDKFSGVAPDARILPVRYGDSVGSPAFDLARAIEYAVEMGAQIVNIGHDADLGASAARRAVEYAATRNVLVVCSAPRSAHASHVEPPPNLISVVSINERMEPLGECARADIAAPGFARVPHWHGTGHTLLENVAVGAPYVSGCAALIKALNPGWGYHELREHLMVSGTPRPELAVTCHAGRLLNVGNAVLGPLEFANDARTLTWSSLNDALLSWNLRYRSAYCVNAVALYRPHGDDHWRELAYARATSLHMVVPAASLRRSSGMLKIASREANFCTDEAALTIR